MSDIAADPRLFILNAGNRFPKDVLQFRPLAPSGTEPLVRFFRCDSPEHVHEIVEIELPR